MGLAVFNTAARIAMREADWVYPYSCRQRWNATAGRMEVLRCPASIGSDRSFSPNSLPYSIAIALLKEASHTLRPVCFSSATFLYFCHPYSFLHPPAKCLIRIFCMLCWSLCPCIRTVIGFVFRLREIIWVFITTPLQRLVIANFSVKS